MASRFLLLATTLGVASVATLLCAALMCAPAQAADGESDIPLQLSSAAPARASAPSTKRRKALVARAPAPSNTIVMRTVRTTRVDPPPALGAGVAPTTGPAKANGLAKGSEATVAKPVAEAVTPPAAALDADIKSFCGNVGRAATDARMAWQAAKLVELEAALRKRTEDYETRIAEWRGWLQRRDDAMRHAEESVVAIYARMRPESAASQIAALDDATAAAVLMKLNPRASSAIMSEIPAERAARLTDAMVGSRTKIADEKKSS